jgi:chemotaxis protein methyltransferase CheR
VTDAELQQLTEAIYLKYHHDFRRYAPASLKRRLTAALAGLKCRTFAQLQDKLVHDPETFAELLDFLTVPVTEMFRDPGYFRALRAQVVPILRTYPSLKVWVAGCGTGEEVYSLAILLRDEQLLSRTLIYATDINPHTLQKASAGVYEATRITACAEANYYTIVHGRVVFDKSLKEHIVFADHSLATDSVFAEVHLVSCRNVLIYFNRELQDRAIGLFREALCRKGFLGIGSKESLRFSAHADFFTELANGNRIYQKRDWR